MALALRCPFLIHQLKRPAPRGDWCCWVQGGDVKGCWGDAGGNVKGCQGMPGDVKGCQGMAGGCEGMPGDAEEMPARCRDPGHPFPCTAAEPRGSPRTPHLSLQRCPHPLPAVGGGSRRRGGAGTSVSIATGRGGGVSVPPPRPAVPSRRGAERSRRGPAEGGGSAGLWGRLGAGPGGRAESCHPPKPP